MKFKPMTDVKSATASSWRRMSSAWPTACAVRATAVPPGICTMTNNAPWSSSGRNPVGVIFDSPTIPTPATPTITNPMTEKRTMRATDDRRGNLPHGLLRRFRDRELGMLLHNSLDVLNHDDGVIDHDADGEHKREKRD